MSYSIVVVDDDQRILTMLLQLLGRAGYQVITIQDSRQALEKIRTVKPDLAILDVLMPHVDGMALCSQIRQDPDLRQVKIAILSAKAYEADKARAFQLGANIYLEKPIQPSEFLERIKALLTVRLKIKFWGTRGSIPTPGGASLKYGGNTSCVEVRLPDDQLLIFDAGTGIRNLGNLLYQDGRRVRAHIFITHPHWDHIQGLPFFLPAYTAGNEFVICGPRQSNLEISHIISSQMETVHFPITIKELAAHISFQQLSEGQYPLGETGAIVDTIFVNHPGFALGYRLTFGTKQMVYMTDNELDSALGSQRVKFVEFVKGVNLLIHDAQYTPEEYPAKKGWGHTTWPQALELALAGQVERLVLFHHDPDHSDADVDAIVAACQARAQEKGSSLECLGAQEGTEIQL